MYTDYLYARYVLDGDKEELRTIRNELAALRSTSIDHHSSNNNINNSRNNNNSDNVFKYTAYGQDANLIKNSYPETTNYKNNNKNNNYIHIRENSKNIEDKMNSSLENNDENTPNSSTIIALDRLLKQRAYLLSTGMYDEGSDPVLLEINKSVERLQDDINRVENS